MNISEVNEILDMNNEAIAFLNEKEFEDAISVLKAAFQNLKKHLEQGMVNENDIHKRSSKNDSVDIFTNRVLHQMFRHIHGQNQKREPSTHSRFQNYDRQVGGRDGPYKQTSCGDIQLSCEQNKLASKMVHIDDKQDIDAQCILSIPILEDALPDLHSKSDSAFRLFNRAMTLSYSIFHDDEKTDCDYQLEAKSSVKLVVILLYNMGLIHHYLGTLSCNSKHMAKAMRLYLLAYNAIENSWEARISSEDLFLLMLALLNNICHIHCSLLNLRQMKLCFTGMRELMSSMDQSTFTIVHEDYLIFHLNLMLTSNELGLLLAPAA